DHRRGGDRRGAARRDHPALGRQRLWRRQRGAARAGRHAAPDARRRPLREAAGRLRRAASRNLHPRQDRSIPMTTPLALSRRTVLTGLGALGALGAVGCSETPPPRMFTLASRPATAAAAGNATMRIVVKPIEVAKYLDRTQIVRYSDPYELKIA